MMYLALTYDHRLLDGREAVTFLIKVCHYSPSSNMVKTLTFLQVKEYIEDPRRMLLG
jgi:pyruvate/2-oxoglutarate dehydrogenase complex dihydrolipoamide acyltransferase (E2) component